ncbi:Trm112 family protein [Nesterenkonia alba]|uniref:Trm112 family protein n=1 Tax=Nesterenkonia alba TaxID=515814 RepID=UPI0003B710B2|nr:hypothetical protein [Nesterenkonia alba]
MSSTPAVDPAILTILRCPTTGSPLRQEGDDLVATEDPALRYPIDRGVPRLLPEDTSA